MQGRVQVSDYTRPRRRRRPTRSTAEGARRGEEKWEMVEGREVSGGFFMFCWRGGRGAARILEIFFYGFFFFLIFFYGWFAPTRSDRIGFEN